MELRHLRYFLDLAQTEHLTQSAENLFVTQSTLSHGLRQLEEELATRLFDRVGRGLKLSEAGHAFRAYAARALQEVEAGRMALAEIAGLKAGTLTVGAVPSFVSNLIPPAAAAFSNRYPNVGVLVKELRAGTIEELLIGGQIDVGISLYPTQRRELKIEPLFDEEMVLVAHAGHRLARRKSVAMSALADVPMATQPKSFATRRLIDAAFRKAGCMPTVRMEMDAVESLAGVCRAGELVTILPERAAHHASDLALVRLHSPTPVRRAGVLWRKGGSRSVAALEFIRLVTAIVAGGKPGA